MYFMTILESLSFAVLLHHNGYCLSGVLDGKTDDDKISGAFADYLYMPSNLSKRWVIIVCDYEMNILFGQFLSLRFSLFYH